jgi:hypothetical protein
MDARVANRARLLKAAIENVKVSFDMVTPHLDLSLDSPEPGPDLDQRLDEIKHQPGEAIAALEDSLKLLDEQRTAYTAVAPQ